MRIQYQTLDNPQKLSKKLKNFLNGKYSLTDCQRMVAITPILRIAEHLYNHSSHFHEPKRKYHTPHLLITLHIINTTKYQ